MRSVSIVVLLAMLAAAGPVRAQSTQAASENDLGPIAEQVVLVVGDRVVTESDLELEARVALVSGGGARAAFAALDADTLASVIDYVINQMLIFAEAKRLEVFDVSDRDVSAALDRFIDRFPDRATWKAFLAAQDVTADRVASILRRNLRVKRYLDSRVKLTVHVSDKEITDFYRAHRKRFGGRSLAEVRDVIHGYLFKKHYEASVRQLVAALRARGEVRVLAHPSGIPARGAPPIAKDQAGVLSKPSP